MKTFPGDEHMELGVRVAEDKFLQGDFSQALKQANRCLTFAASVAKDPTTVMMDDCFRPPAPLHFPFVLNGTPLYIRINCNKAQGSDYTDRAAAVALQSWYELSKIDDSKNERAFRFLEPFWKAYSAESSHRCCSLDLALILIQFSCATTNVHEAMELALATLHYVFQTHESFLLDNQDHNNTVMDTIQEFLVFVFQETLPYCTNSKAVSKALSKFKQPDWDSSASSNWDLSAFLNADATREVILFLENPPLHWPDECKTVLGECRESLEGLFEDMDGDAKQHALVVPMTATREASGRYSFLPTLGWDGSYQQWLCRVLYLTRICIVQPLVFSERRWENRAKTTVALWSLWMAWRQKRRLSKGSKVALKFFLKPLVEIIEALLPSSIHKNIK